jgi:hypothetical protein
VPIWLTNNDHHDRRGKNEKYEQGQPEQIRTQAAGIKRGKKKGTTSGQKEKR